METDNGALPPSHIVKFIRRHHVLTLATYGGREPWCSSMFYAYVPELNAFVFTSEERTRHIGDLSVSDRVAASVVLETRTVGRVQGLQITGRLERVAGDETGDKLRRAYLRRFPYAAVAELTLWALRPSFMKLTDNTLGFGKKIVWESSL